MNFKKVFCSLGWGLLIALLLSTVVVNAVSNDDGNLFTPISWEKNVKVFEGVLACTLLPDDLNERVAMLKEEVFTKDIPTEELEDGYIFYFEDKGETAEKLFDFLSIEKRCCPFFKFDLSILPFKEGMALKISGGARVKSFIEFYMD